MWKHVKLSFFISHNNIAKFKFTLPCSFVQSSETDVPKQEYGQGTRRRLQSRFSENKNARSKSKSETLLFLIGLTQHPDPEDGGRCS